VRESSADLEEACELGDLEGVGGEEDLRHEGDGGAAADVRATVVVDADAGRLGQVADAAAVEVLDHQQQRLVPDLHIVADQLPGLDHPTRAFAAGREEVAQEGAERAEHAPVHAQLGRAGRRDDARVREESEVFGAAECVGEVVREAAQRAHVRQVLHGGAVGVRGRYGGHLAVR
jgi:hypothetical protein